MDRIITVDDDEVKGAMRAYFSDTHNVAEGSGAAGLAALLKDSGAGGERVGTVLTGGNVNSAIFGEILSSGGNCVGIAGDERRRFWRKNS